MLATKPTITPLTLVVTNQAHNVINFWFSSETKKYWFNRSHLLDDLIKQQFSEIYQEAINGKLDHWQKDPQPALALVILLDQLSRHLYRGSIKAYKNDAFARQVARNAIRNGYDNLLDDTMRAFFYMPFMHSENLDDQDYSVELFSKAGLDNTRWAIHHRDIIRRFGRFPHRNAILGRNNTPDEDIYLASENAFTG